MNSGSATLTSAAGVKVGIVNTGPPSVSEGGTSWNDPVAQVTAKPAMRAASTAKRSKKRLPRKKVTTMLPAISGALANAPAAATTKGSRMPASSACNTGPGTLESNHPNQPVNPTIAAATDATRNAPTASANEKPPKEAMSSAAPGVDHATMTGMRVKRLSTMLHRPLPIDSAHTQEAVCASSRPAARVASSTIRKGPAKLMSAERNPATTAETDTSRRTTATRLIPAMPRQLEPSKGVTDLPNSE